MTAEHREEIRGRVPDDRPVQTEVLVNDDVPGGTELRRRDVWMADPEVLGEPGGSLSDHGQLVKHRRTGRCVPQEAFAILPGDM